MFGGHLFSLRGLPPLIICTLFITAFALTTLWVAYFVRTEVQLENGDTQSDWKTFLKYLIDQEICIQPTSYLSVNSINNVTFKAAQNENYTELISVNILASLNLAMLPLNVTYVQGLITMTGWKNECATSMSGLDQSLIVSFTIPNTEYINSYGNNKSETISQNICVTMTGPKSLLPAISDSINTCANGEDLGAANAFALLKSRVSPPALGERVDPWCADGFLARILYKVSNNGIVLSLNDRSIINLHLMHTSYCLFVMAVTLICYAVIRGRPKGKTILNITVDKIPLDP